MSEVSLRSFVAFLYGLQQRGAAARSDDPAWRLAPDATLISEIALDTSAGSVLDARVSMFACESKSPSREFIRVGKDGSVSACPADNQN